MDLELVGKVAIVTGASDGIGLASAERLSSEGARVTICARRETLLRRVAEDIERRTGGEVLAVAGDVRSDADVERVIESTLERFGGIDILFNNAGASNAYPLFETSDELWREDLEVKLFGALRFARAAIPHMRKRGGGRIVNVTTISGKAPPAQALPTSVSRAAGINLSKSLAAEFAPEGILVNTICLGSVKSAFWEERHAREAPGVPLDTWYAQAARERGVPVGRLGEPEEVADLVAFLASARASFITGAAINIDGGAAPVW